MGAIGEVVPHSLATSFRADWSSMVLKIYELKEWKALLGMQLRSFGEVDSAKLARPNELHSGGSATEMSFSLLPRLLVDFSHVSSPVLQTSLASGAPALIHAWAMETWAKTTQFLRCLAFVYTVW